MTVGVQVGSIVDSVGAPSFFNAFFSTVVATLERGERGARFPTVTETFYSGRVPPADVGAALAELRDIRRELAELAPTGVVWDLEDREARPPWGEDISDEIASLAEYFVTDTGRDLFELLLEAFEEAVQTSGDVAIVEF